MGHYIHGLVANYEKLLAAANRFDEPKVCRLALGYGFMPAIEEMLSEDELASGAEYFSRLLYPFGAWAEEQSRDYPIAYVETNYYGGRGEQSAIAWKSGAVTFGPLTTPDFEEDSTPMLELAINRALREIGVLRGDNADEFGALGLGGGRDIAQWAKLAVGK